jgi:hypothetical protein
MKGGECDHSAFHGGGLNVLMKLIEFKPCGALSVTEWQLGPDTSRCCTWKKIIATKAQNCCDEQ